MKMICDNCEKLICNRDIRITHGLEITILLFLEIKWCEVIFDFLFVSHCEGLLDVWSKEPFFEGLM